jgi:TonB family protein
VVPSGISVVHNHRQKAEQMTVLRFVALIALSGIIAAQPLHPASERPLRIPFVPDSRILRKASPVYPLAAVQRRIQGSVCFSALIGKDGRVEGLRWISGHPLLVAAAREAAAQWVYRPATVGGVPVRVITRIQIRFALETYIRPGPVAAKTRSDSDLPGNSSSAF